MKKKLFTGLMFLLVPAVMTFAQVKNYVGVVHPVFSDNTVEFLNKFSDDCIKHNNRDLAKAIDDYVNGGSFGSGFVYVAPNGDNYIITNRHVAEFAKTLKVDFTNEDGSKTSYENLTILALGKDLDVAVLAFPAGVKPFKSGFTFETRKVQDGDDVWTAGFPAFEGKPAWQFGTGTVTNNAASIESLVNPEVSTVIQHSAQIDGGSSGGPLLVKNANTALGYSVVGINTWKATNRQDTNFSIPAKAVKQFIDDAIDGKFKGIDSPEEVSKQALSFAETVAKRDATYADIISFISMEYIHQFGASTFNEVLNECPRGTFEDIANVFIYDSPVEGFRFAIAWKLWNEFHLVNSKRDTESVQSFTTPEKVEGSDRYKVTYTLPYKDGSADVEWINEYGTWVLYSFKNNNEKAHNKASKSRQADAIGNLDVLSPYSIAFSAGTTFEFTGTVKSEVVPFNFEMEISDSNSNFVSAIFGFDVSKVEDCKLGEDLCKDGKEIAFKLGSQLQMPMSFDSFTVMPYGNLCYRPTVFIYQKNEYMSSSRSSDRDFKVSVLGIEANVGVRGVYSVSSYFHLFANVAYKIDFTSFFFENEKKLRHGVYVGGGIAF